MHGINIKAACLWQKPDDNHMTTFYLDLNAYANFPIIKKKPTMFGVLCNPVSDKTRNDQTTAP